MSRAAWLASFHLRSGALRTRLFPPSKWAGLFPSAAYRRPRPRSRRKAYATLADWDALAWWGQFSRAVGWRILETMLACGASRETFRRAAVCTGQSAEDHIRPASRGTCRATAVTSQPSCFPTSTPAPEGCGVGSRDTAPCASREACRRAAVKPRPTRMSLYAPARHRRAVRGKGRREEARAQWAQPP